jgi:vitamin B12 transporter
MDVSHAALLAPILACASLGSLAQAPATYGNLQVFAERAPLLRLDGTQAIAVITREEIAARQPMSVLELLREVAGLHVDRMGNASGVTNLYIRGADPNHTVVLIDGVRVNDPTDVRGGSVDLSTLDVDAIERVEVLRGASSA